MIRLGARGQGGAYMKLRTGMGLLSVLHVRIIANRFSIFLSLLHPSTVLADERDDE